MVDKYSRTNKPIEVPLATVGKLVLAGLGLAAFGWAFAALKPIPQGVLIGLPLVALLIDAWAGNQAKPLAFLVTSSVTAAGGYLFAGSALVTLADQRLFPVKEQRMPIGTLLAGAALGLALFALTYFVLLRPSVHEERTRRAGLVAILMMALISWSLDRLVFA